MAREQIGQSPADIEEVIQEASRLLVEVAQPEKITLFGSSTRGACTKDSDLDLLGASLCRCVT
jgi:predicted nucleotidyltransferase